MNVWLNIYNRAPASWMTAAFKLAVDRTNNDDHSQIVVTVFDKAVAAENKKQARLPFEPCGKVGHNWFYLENGEPVILTKKYVKKRKPTRK